MRLCSLSKSATCRDKSRTVRWSSGYSGCGARLATATLTTSVILLLGLSACCVFYSGEMLL
jgi:hypothetical protein